ncbi:hypothetical protein AA0472_1620 [Acetobacter estunensis NRIC 0472]|nr:hypothetical protein AA0472_1620 [Acetobacter estunensis NRIC 0472]
MVKSLSRTQERTLSVILSFKSPECGVNARLSIFAAKRQPRIEIVGTPRRIMKICPIDRFGGLTKRKAFENSNKTPGVNVISVSRGLRADGL